jgi:hypothetical protein
MKKYLKIIGIGAIIWSVAFVVACVFVGFKVSSELLIQGITTLAVLTATFLFARSLNVSGKAEMLKYVLIWILVGLTLDAIITTRFAGWEFFLTWHIWVSYALSIPVSLLAVKVEKK